MSFDQPTPGSAADLQSEADPEQVARTILLRKLEAAPRTRSELETVLRKRNIPDEVTTAVLDRFTEVGLINDEEFAAAWVGSRQRGRKLAPRALADELRRKGVAPDTIAVALELISDDEVEAAGRTLVRKKLKSMTGVSRQTATRRLVSMLARKGYPSGLAYRIVADELGSDVIVESA